MNEYLERRLHEELSEAVARRYGDQEKEWRDSGAQVTRRIQLTPDHKSGRHTATVRFTLLKEGRISEVAAFYEYRPSPRSSQPAYWYMAKDWKD